jgi:hypothetical protein
VTERNLASAVADVVLHLGRAGRFALRFILLSFALLCYGSVPGSGNIQTEYESQLQEEIASNHFDIRTNLRGAAQRRAGTTLCVISVESTRQAVVRSAVAEQHSQCVSFGLDLPMRC